jgi:predicted nucleic acid-binding protein
MILVDTSVWIDHFREADLNLIMRLNSFEIGSHPWVIAELACGNLKNRHKTLESLSSLFQYAPIKEDALLNFIAEHGLMGKGIGLVDVQLLASCYFSNSKIWTRDKRLLDQAVRLGVDFKESTFFH